MDQKGEFDYRLRGTSRDSSRAHQSPLVYSLPLQYARAVALTKDEHLLRFVYSLAECSFDRGIGVSLALVYFVSLDFNMALPTDFDDEWKT